MNSSIEQQASSLEMSSAAIEEMVSNINSVTDVVNKSENLFNELKQASDHGMKLVETVSSQTRAIAGQSESLIQANSVIAGIASQTNLLAMNAAIEAAHAGEAGKGFSVVADEIRKLAEESAKQSKTIGSSLKKVIDSIDTIVESTDESVKAFSDVTVIVDTLLPSSTQIAGAMAEQNTGSGQILESLSSLKNITDEVQKWSTQMMQNGVVLRGLMGELNEVSAEVSVSMTEIEKGTDEINSTAGNTAELAERNMQSIAVLSKQTSRFKI